MIGKVFWPGAAPHEARRPKTCCTRSSGRSSSAATAARRSPARPSTRSSTCSSATSPTGRSRARARAEKHRAARSGSSRSRGDRSRGPRRDARPPLPRGALARRGGRAATRRRSASPRGRASPRRAARALARAPARRATSSRSMRSRLTPTTDPQRPTLQLARRLRGRLAEHRRRRPAARAGDRGLHRPGRSRRMRPRQPSLLGSDLFYRGDMEGAAGARAPGARARPPRLRPPPSTALALAQCLEPVAHHRRRPRRSARSSPAKR